MATIRKTKQRGHMILQLSSTGVRPLLPTFRYAIYINIYIYIYIYIFQIGLIISCNIPSLVLWLELESYFLLWHFDYRFLTTRRNWKRWRTWPGRNLLLLYEGKYGFYFLGIMLYISKLYLLEYYFYGDWILFFLQEK